ncbi:uncharacterized protein LOC111745408 isoform X2 [Pteropus vampyrus]|uniref:Uncharacterized protein LOC111745408 isoform X2 n=1 Tax=Pteropus vampyrus TaxID=132908 RepID=A0A6P6CX72_PTEVA|nr:uncharacterized protein LOC111745408 isoform X2 [Pteropus vampyrus]
MLAPSELPAPQSRAPVSAGGHLVNFNQIDIQADPGPLPTQTRIPCSEKCECSSQGAGIVAGTSGNPKGLLRGRSVCVGHADVHDLICLVPQCLMKRNYAAIELLRTLSKPRGHRWGCDLLLPSQSSLRFILTLIDLGALGLRHHAFTTPRSF